MKRTKHTPGPWSADSNFEDSCFVGQPDGVAVASMVCGDGQDMNANARLIAAAPEMLDALEDARTLLCDLANGDARRSHSREMHDRLEALLTRLGVVS